MKLISPIPKKFQVKRVYTDCTQWFGENKNKLFYGASGHTGIDMRTKGAARYIKDKIKGYVTAYRTKEQEVGLGVPILAAHDGYLSNPYNDDKVNGVYVKIRSVDGNFETFYFHLEKIRVWAFDDKMTGYEKKNGENFVKAGSIIGYSGNTGRFTTGAHLHFEIRKLVNGVWTKINPLPYFQDETIYRKTSFSVFKDLYYKGEKITTEQAKKLENKILNIWDS